MKKIALISDTHGDLDEKVFNHLESVDEIWHAGDIGSIELLHTIKTLKPTKAVFGNIDNWEIRSETSEKLRFMCENVEVLLTHIGGYPGKYDFRIRKQLQENPPKLFICGHSHILKVIYDKKLDFLHMNPGAIGFKGFHRLRTFLKFSIDGSNIKDLQIVEYERQQVLR